MMEITCPSCSTVYNVAAEQLTGKGVNFRCSQCEFVFKVRKSTKDPIGPIQIQRVSVGDVLAYDEMADVQRDIIDGKLSRRDQLSERGGAWRELGQFQNLAPFFTIVERSSQLERETESTQDQPTVSTSTRGFSPVKVFDDEPPAELPPRTNISDSAFAGRNARNKRSGTATFSPLAEDVLNETPPPAPQKRDIPPAAEVESQVRSNGNTPAQTSLEDEYFESRPTPVHSDSDDFGEDLTAYEQNLRQKRGGKIFVALLLLVIVGTVAVVYFRDEIGQTEFGSKLPYFSQQRTRADQPAEAQTTAQSSEGGAITPPGESQGPADNNVGIETPDAQEDSASDGQDIGEASTAASAATQGSGAIVYEEIEGGEDENPDSTTEDELDPTDETSDEIADQQNADVNDAAAQTAAREQAAREQAAREQAAREQAAREEAARQDQTPPATPEGARAEREDRDEPDPEPVEENVQEMSADRAIRYGRRALANRNPAAAVEAFERAVRLQPNNADYHVKLGQAYQAAGDNAGAHRAYTNALNVNSRYMPAIFGIADVERNTGRRDAAIERYQSILRISASGDRAEQAKNALRGLGVSVD